MRRVTVVALSILGGAVLMLVPAGAVWFLVMKVEEMTDPVLRPLAFLGVVLSGSAAFVLATYLATHLVIHLCRSSE